MCVGVCIRADHRRSDCWLVVGRFTKRALSSGGGGRHRRSLNDAVNGNSNYGNLTSCVVAETNHVNTEQTSFNFT